MHHRVSVAHGRALSQLRGTLARRICNSPIRFEKMWVIESRSAPSRLPADL
jgi:hypothetical protein